MHTRATTAYFDETRFEYYVFEIIEVLIVRASMKRRRRLENPRFTVGNRPVDGWRVQGITHVYLRSEFSKRIHARPWREKPLRNTLKHLEGPTIFDVLSLTLLGNC